MTPIDILAKLVSFPTIPAASNLDLIHWVRDYLAALNVSSQLIHSPDGTKANLFATIGPNVPGGVVLSGHTDVVPVEGQDWTSDPFTLTRRGDKFYGRGSCDMKGFDAAALALVPDMLKAGLKRPIHLALSYDEEIGCLGAPLMVDEMVRAGLKPSAVIVGEPSRMKVVSAHKSGLRYWVTVTGKSVHSSRIDTGVSAVMVAARLITWHDDRLRANAAKADANNPFEPPYTTLHCGVVEGGSAPNITADHCKFTAEIRALPTEEAEDILAAFRRYVEEDIVPEMKRIAPQSGVAIEVWSSVKGLRPEENGAAEQLARRLTGDNGSHVVAYGTEGGIFQAGGFSTVICGPGDIAQAHQVDEYIEESEMVAATRFLQGIVAELSA